MDAIRSLLTLATAPGAPIAPAIDPAGVDSVWDLVIKGGPVMIPIGICSLVALALAAERLLALRRRNVIPPGFVEGLEQAMNGDGGGRARALEHCDQHPSPLANICKAGLKRLGMPLELVERHIEEAGQREVVSLRKRLRAISLITSISPLLGLLGTIMGMITAFRTVSTSAEALGRTEMLAEGIYEAMITTAAGLIVAIPCMILYHVIAAKVDRLVAEMDAVCVDFVESHALPLAHRPPPPADNGHTPHAPQPARVTEPAAV